MSVFHKKANAVKEDNKRKRADTMRRILKFIRPQIYLVVISLLLAALSVVLQLLIPIYTGNAVDLILGIGNVDFSGILVILRKIVICILITAAAQWTMNHVNNVITYRVVKELRTTSFHHLHELPLSYLDVHSSGDLISRIITDVEQFSDGLLLGFTQLFTGVLTILGTIIFMLRLQPVMALIVVFLTPLSFQVAKFISGRSFQFFKNQSASRGKVTEYTNEMLGNLKVVQTFGYEDEVQKEFNDRNEELGQNSLKATFISSLTNPSTRLTNNTIYNAVTIAGCLICYLTPFGGTAMTIGMLSSFLSYVKQYSQPFNEITGVMTEFQNSLASAARVFELIDEASEPKDLPNASVMHHADGEVNISHVSFSYVPEKPLIQDFNVRIHSGQRVAIVGPTGCGKTTLINLLMRFYDVNSGSISVDGTDIREIQRISLRGNYGMVLQDTWLKAGTIRENIAYGDPEASMDEIVQAAKDAHADSFIRKMQQGYDTVIEENGGNLSAGQKQLLCIARVMLHLPPILILDEATSSIDTRTEINIQRAFDQMMKGRTSFVVAHRLSTVRDSDIILVMNNGNIVEQGNHEELLSRNGFYSQLYNAQFARSEE